MSRSWRSAVQELGEDNALASAADVTDEEAVSRAAAEGEDRFGQLDIVVSNAGISGDVSEIADYPSDVFARTLEVHVLGAFHVLKHTIPASATAAASSSRRASLA